MTPPELFGQLASEWDIGTMLLYVAAAVGAAMGLFFGLLGIRKGLGFFILVIEERGIARHERANYEDDLFAADSAKADELAELDMPDEGFEDRMAQYNSDRARRAKEDEDAFVVTFMEAKSRGLSDQEAGDHAWGNRG